jgi:hypothetical protein
MIKELTLVGMLMGDFAHMKGNEMNAKFDPAAAWDAYLDFCEAQHEPSDSDFLANADLDAYGHLAWTVGNEDYIACFDAVLSGDKTRIAYHVVVNCESGGFLDTIEQGVVPVEEAKAKLHHLPDSYLDSCCEQYAGEYEYPIDINECQQSIKSWNRHIDILVKQANNDA